MQPINLMTDFDMAAMAGEPQDTVASSSPSQDSQKPSSLNVAASAFDYAVVPMTYAVGNGKTTFNVFVGDLGREVDAAMLRQAFSAYPSLCHAKVLLDHLARTRGFGFVAFRSHDDAERAIIEMNGAWLGSRQIRVDWGMGGKQAMQAMQSEEGTVPQQQQQQQQKSPSSPKRNQAPRHGKTKGVPNGTRSGKDTLEYVESQAPYHVSIVYVGNLPEMSEVELASYFQPFGFVHEIRIQHGRGFAFVSMDSHESASHAIVALNNSLVRDRNIKVWWGRERSPSDAGLPPLAPEFELYVDPQAAAYFGPGPTVWIPASGTIPQPPSPGSEASTYRLYPQFVAYPAAAIAPEA